MTQPRARAGVTARLDRMPAGQVDTSAFDLPRVSPARRKRAAEIFDALAARYPDAHCELDATTPHELLVATILSAQATDVGVNKATPALFAAFPTPADYARATPEAIEPLVRSLGFFRNKARAVHEAMTRVATLYGGEVPRTMEDLLTLRGVARKTANVVLSNAYGINLGVVVDTHVQRLAARFRLSAHTDPIRIERDLMALFPRPAWGMLSHLLIWHGRRVCKARGAGCADDPICRLYCTGARGAAASPRSSRAATSSTARAARDATECVSTATRRGRSTAAESPGRRASAARSTEPSAGRSSSRRTPRRPDRSP